MIPWNDLQTPSDLQHITLILIICLLCSTCCLVIITVFIVGEELGFIAAHTPTTLPAPTSTPIQPSNTPIPTSTPVPSKTQTPVPTNTTTNTIGPIISPTSVPTMTIPPTPFPTAGAPCDCTGPNLNCDSNFLFHDEAQACYNYCVSLGFGDIFGLDGNNDGIACEELP